MRLHEAQAHIAELRRHAVHVAAQDGGEVGVDDGGLAAADQLHQRAGLVRDGDLREAGGARQLRHAPLVLRVRVAVHEGDRDRVQTGAAGLLQPAPRPFLVERPHDLAVRADALVHLEHARVGRARAGGCRARRCPAGPGSRCAGRRRTRAWSRRASATPRAPGARWSPPSCPCGPRRRAPPGSARRPRAEQTPHPFDGGVLVPRRVLREQLARAQAAARRARHHVGERAAAVDPEAPALGRARPPLSALSVHHRARLPRAPRDVGGSRLRVRGMDQVAGQQKRRPGAGDEHRHTTTWSRRRRRARDHRARGGRFRPRRRIAARAAALGCRRGGVSRRPGGRPLGRGRGRRGRRRAALPRPAAPVGTRRELLLYAIGVRTAHRRRGIGTALVREMLAVGARRTHRGGWVVADNPGAEAFYAACGFAPGDEERAVYLQRRVARDSEIPPRS